MASERLSLPKDYARPRSDELLSQLCHTGDQCHSTLVPSTNMHGVQYLTAITRR